MAPIAVRDFPPMVREQSTQETDGETMPPSNMQLIMTLLALLAAGVPRVVALFGVQSWRWDWVREVRKLVFARE